MKQIDIPNTDNERELFNIEHDVATIVKVRNKAYKIRGMRGVTMEKITEIYLSKGNDRKASCMVGAAIVLNNFFLLKFFYSFLWRWFYYIKGYTESELSELLAVGKKKLHAESYFINTILLTDMRDTMMMMKKEEVLRIRQEQSTAQNGK